MKTLTEELDEMIDVVTKLVWTFTIFQALFKKKDPGSEVRNAHPQFFLTMHDSLLCSFCVAVEILFEEKEKATSLWSLIRQSSPQPMNELARKIDVHRSSIKKIEAMRHQVCAHRWKAKSPQQVFIEVQLRFSMMTEIADLARVLILDLVGEMDGNRKTELEQQQLSESALISIADDAANVLESFHVSE